MDNARMEVEALLDNLLHEWDEYSARVRAWDGKTPNSLHTERFENARKQIEDRLLANKGAA